MQKRYVTHRRPPLPLYMFRFLVSQDQFSLWTQDPNLPFWERDHISLGKAQFFAMIISIWSWPMVLINNNQWKSACDRDYYDHHQCLAKSSRRVRGFHEAPNCNSQEEIFDIEEECCTDKIVQPKASIIRTTMLKQCTSYNYTSSAIGYFSEFQMISWICK